ncbi:MAG: NAD(P)-dependent alcohol dehydrogenase [Chloroflexota bacterium]
MKAVVFTEYGSPDVLTLQDVTQPTPTEKEILVRVRATSVSYGDLLVRDFGNVGISKFNMPAPLWLPARLSFGWSKPKVNILGAEFAGDVEAIGNAVTRFQVGDAVFGYLGQTMGANAEYITIAEDGLVEHKPTNIPYPEASAIAYGATMAIPILEKVNIQAGQKVLINGASGSIGSVALQIAKYKGTEVTGVCSTNRLDYVRELGANHVIDYTTTDFTQNSIQYDVIFDVLGKSSFTKCRHSLTENGIYLLASFKTGHLLDMLWTSFVGNKKVICALSDEHPKHLSLAKKLAQSGDLKTIIDRCYPLEETANAHRYIESGQRTGQVIIML